MTLPVLPRAFLSAVVANPLLLVPCLVGVAITFGVELGRAVSIATAPVAGERLESNVSEHMRLQAVRAAAVMIAAGPGAQENGSGRLFPRRRESIVENIVRKPSDLGKLLDIAGGRRQLGLLLEDCSAEYGAPLDGHG